MDEAAKVWNPSGDETGYARGKESGTGRRPEKHPVATLEVWPDNVPPFWLMYGGVNGGCPGDDRFEVFFTGMVRMDGRDTIGRFRLIVEGSNLANIRQQIAKQTRAELRVGDDTENATIPAKVRSITVEPHEVEDNLG